MTWLEKKSAAVLAKLPAEFRARAERQIARHLGSASSVLDVERLATNSSSPTTRATTVWFLARASPRAAVDVARELLTDAVPSVRANAIVALVVAQRQPAVAPLVGMATKDRSVRVRAVAIWALAFTARPPDALFAAIASDASAPALLRDHAVEAMGRPGARHNLKVVRALLDDHDRRVAASAAHAVGEIRGDLSRRSRRP